jgi:hypothetical protein
LKPVSQYQVIDLFNTSGTAPHGFADVASGVGATPAEAIQGALVLLAGNGWDVRGLGPRILAETDWAPRSSAVLLSSYFISVYVR